MVIRTRGNRMWPQRLRALEMTGRVAKNRPAKHQHGHQGQEDDRVHAHAADTGSGEDADVDVDVVATIGEGDGGDLKCPRAALGPLLFVRPYRRGA